MARKWHPSARVAALGLAAAFVAAAAPAATAQLPGDNPRVTIYPVENTGIQLSVQPLDEAEGTVDLVVQNNTATNLNCTGLVDGGPAATVTTADVVARSVDYFRNYPITTYADLQLNLPSPAGTQMIGLGSVQDQAGSLSEFINPEWGALVANGNALDAARLAGHYGALESNISIPANSAFERTVRLDLPVQGARSDFQTGVFMTCTIGGQRYAFHAYEGDVEPNINGTGSLSSLGLGS